MLTALRQLRHGPLRRMGSLWRRLGRGYRQWQDATGLPRSVKRRIGRFGPFRLNGRFAFSNFDPWGEGHNSGFNACIEACRNARCVIDIGAHIGLVSLPASQVVAAQGKVFAFEPAQGNLRFLRDHKELNQLGNLEVIDMLVGETDEDAIPFNELPGDSGLNSVATTAKLEGHQSFRRQVSLDTFCASRGLKPDVIKIDVEGYELHVLRGAATVLRNARPLIVLSVHPHQISLLGGSLEGLGGLIAKLNYESRTPDGRKAGVLSFGEYILHPLKQGGTPGTPAHP